MAAEAFGEVGDGGRRVWSRARWRTHARPQAESGEPLSAYRDAREMTSQSFYRWRRIVRDEQGLAAMKGRHTEPAAAGESQRPVREKLLLPV